MGNKKKPPPGSLYPDNKCRMIEHLKKKLIPIADIVDLLYFFHQGTDGPLCPYQIF